MSVFGGKAEVTRTSPNRRVWTRNGHRRSKQKRIAVSRVNTLQCPIEGLHSQGSFRKDHGAKNPAGNAAGVTAASKRTGSFAISIDLLRSIRMKRRPLAGGGLLAPSLELFSQMFVEESGDLLERILGFR